MMLPLDVENLSLLRALGWTLTHFLWQGVLIFIALEITLLILRRSKANVRYVAACGALFLMLCVGTFTFVRQYEIEKAWINEPLEMLPSTTPRLPQNSGRLVLPRNPGPQGDRWSRTAVDVEVLPDVPESKRATTVESALSTVTKHIPKRLVRSLSPRIDESVPYFVLFWSLGVFILSLRLLLGWKQTRMLVRQGTLPATEKLQQVTLELCRVLKLRRTVRVLESSLAQVPTVIGWLRPVVLVPVSASMGLSAKQLEALLAHELAHVRRHDYLVNLCQSCVETLLFYHPAVWWVSNRIRNERENCCDDVAVELCGSRFAYAKALTSMEELRQGALQPAMAMSSHGGSLLLRIQRLVLQRGRSCDDSAAPRWFAGAFGVGIVVMTLLAVQLSADVTLEEREPKAMAAQNSDEQVRVDDSNGLEVSNGLGRKTALEEAQPAPQLPDPTYSEPCDEAEGLRADTRSASGRFSLDEVIDLKIHDVTPGYIDAFAAIGYVDLSADELIQLRVHDVQPSLVQGLETSGWENLAIDDLVHLQTHGVDTEYLTELVGFSNASFSLKDATRLYNQGVDKHFLEELQGAGLRFIDQENLARLFELDVDGDTIRDFANVGLVQLTPEELIVLLEADVEPIDVGELVSLGLQEPSPDLLAYMSKIGLDADTVNDIVNGDWGSVSTQLLVEFKNLGLEADFESEYRRRNP